MQLLSITVKINDETNHQDITQLHFDVSSQFVCCVEPNTRNLRT